ncbi:hypothetical protein BKA67DRAFT_653742 [Truncatella angustata]|uniref:Zn(2)-C6 fungal-type domain-containing protein n=1 Tax=Truncatella angustata TaxID=152316 RepID=A0A9P9A3K6_9PEZI|nr:uncharacterized protein BKA67DRAFT_653742 [Truncatella angustata]KAH6660572.1 hypothetical protein BKA67DRAFT_653742 [Truncatella angustata]
MSYQYPPPPQSGADLDLTHSGYLSNYPTSATSSLEVRNQHAPSVHPAQPVLPGQGNVMSLVQRRETLSKALKFKRSQSSTPNVRQQGTESTHGQFGSAGEKKRNKLGYHRTSVACTHCRRRKIRCIPYVNDPQGRCQNCIRLKKECTFHSVGQELPPSSIQRPGVRTGVGPKIASASTSPTAPNHPSDISPSQPYPQIATVASLQNMGPPIKPDPYSRDVKLPSNATTNRGFQYGNSGNNWVATDAGTAASKTPEMNTSWRSYTQDSPVTPSFAPYTPHPHSASTWSTAPLGTPASNDSTSRPDEIAWSPYTAAPGRSLSYGGDTSQPYTPVPHVVGSAPSSVYDRRSSIATEMYPPSISTTMAHVDSIPGTSMDPNGPLSAGAGNYGTWQYPYSKTGDGYESWGNQIPPNTDHSSQNVYYASR